MDVKGVARAKNVGSVEWSQRVKNEKGFEKKKTFSNKSFRNYGFLTCRSLAMIATASNLLLSSGGWPRSLSDM